MRHDDPAPADLIFVMAGRMDRKPYGIELFRARLAPVLILSVGRFEVSKMAWAGLDGSVAQRLVALRDATPPGERHFFIRMDGSGVTIEKAHLLRWSTYGEILELRKLVRAGKARQVIVISTDIHLRRVALTCRRVFRDDGVAFLYCAVPRPAGSKEACWFLTKEVVKLVGYWAILLLPRALAWRLMRLKGRPEY